jgi:hypothetical protein
MSFGDPFGPLRPGFGPDVVRDVPDGRPDVRFEPNEIHRPRPGYGIAEFLKFCGVFGAATLGLTVLVSIPVVISEIATIDTISLQGETLTAAQFVSRLENLLIGSFIIAVAVVSFIASAALGSPHHGVRFTERDPSLSERQKTANPISSAHKKAQSCLSGLKT